MTRVDARLRILSFARDEVMNSAAASVASGVVLYEVRTESRVLFTMARAATPDAGLSRHAQTRDYRPNVQYRLASPARYHATPEGAFISYVLRARVTYGESVVVVSFVRPFVYVGVTTCPRVLVILKTPIVLPDGSPFPFTCC